jgi:predicted AAA+ superfamily ATPase
MAERASDNLNWTRGESGALNPGEETEEKISLSERFGLWISFYPFSQDEYLAIVAQWLRGFDVPEDAIAAARQESLVWALERGSRSGRVAFQFAKDYSGRHHA